MGLINSIKNIFRRGEESTPIPPTAREGAIPMWYGALPYSNMSVATVNRCVKLLSDSVAQLTMLVQWQRDGIFQTDPKHHLMYLLNVEPNREMSGYDLWSMAIANVLQKGNAYILPEFSWTDMTYKSLTLLSPGSVSYNLTNEVYRVNDSYNGIKGTYKPGEIIHLKWISDPYNPMRGISVLEHARQTIDLASRSERHALDTVVSGGTVRAILSNDNSGRGMGDYRDTDVHDLSTDIDDMLKSGRWIVSTPGDVHAQVLGMSAADMQFLESRRFTVREICRFFGVHPSFVYDDTSNNYKSAEMANVAFLSNTLNPLLRMIEVELQRKLVLSPLPYRYRFRFDRRDLYATDLEGRTRYYSTMIGCGLLTVNEARRLEGMPDVERGDTPLVSANLKTIDQTNEQYDETGAPI